MSPADRALPDAGRRPEGKIRAAKKEGSCAPAQRFRSVIRRLCAALLSATLALSAGCASSRSGSAALQPAAPIKIGYLASLTGYCAAFARQYVEGAQLAINQINAHGGVLGHRLALIVRDDRLSPNMGVIQARDLVVASHVKFLAGTCSSAVAKNIGQLVANPSHVLYVAGVADPTIFEGGPSIYIFDTIPTVTVEAKNAAAYMRAHPRYKRIAVVSEDYSYGYQLSAAFQKAMRGSGQRIVSQEYLPSGSTDFFPFIEKLIAERPDAVYSTIITEDALTLVRQGLALGLFSKTNFFGVMDYAALQAMPAAPLGAQGYTYYPSAAIYHTPFAADLRVLGRRVADGGAAGDAFNQIEIIAQGIAKARSTDPTAVRDALGGAQVQTVQGNVEIHSCNHLSATPIAMGRVLAASSTQPFVHLGALKFSDTNRYLGC